MTVETYKLLNDLSMRRIEREWSLTESQRSLMRAITLLSYAEGQSWALIPSQDQLAVALRVHKATICRAIRSCITMGILERLERRDETLYRVRPNAEGVPRAADDESEKMMRQLVELQRVRLQGKADGSGQMRLDGILPSEEIDAPADAFEAELRNPDLDKRSGGEEEPESDESFQARLMRHVQESEAKPPDPPPRAPTGRESRWISGTAKMNDGQKRVMAMLREECRQTNAQSEADLIQWVYRWATEVRKRARVIEELIAEHKYLRLTGKGFESTCKFIHAQLEKLDAAAVESG